MRQNCGQGQGVRPLCASNNPWARPGVRTGRGGNLRPASAPPVPVLGFTPPAPPLGGTRPRHVRERKYSSGCQCGICPSQTDKLCAQQTASLLSEKPGGFFDSLKPPFPVSGEWGLGGGWGFAGTDGSRGGSLPADSKVQDGGNHAPCKNCSCCTASQTRCRASSTRSWAWRI